MQSAQLRLIRSSIALLLSFTFSAALWCQAPPPDTAEPPPDSDKAEPPAERPEAPADKPELASKPEAPEKPFPTRKVIGGVVMGAGAIMGAVAIQQLLLWIDLKDRGDKLPKDTAEYNTLDAAL